MNADDRERVRKIVDQDGWNIIWIGAKMPCEFLDEEVELLYEDMDGQPCIHKAPIHHRAQFFFED